jgi:hypothetical protein
VAGPAPSWTVRCMAVWAFSPMGRGSGGFRRRDHGRERRTALASTLVHRASLVGFREFGIRDLVMVADPDHSAVRIHRRLGLAGSEIQIQLSRPSP